MTQEEQQELTRALAVFIAERVDAVVEARMKEWRHVGAYDETKQYWFGNMVQRNGSSWHCRVAESKGSTPGESSDWTLISKSGRDGRDANRQPTGIPARRIG
jgi:hypothetical protein